MFIATYYPATGQEDELCYQNRDMMGTGTANCSTTLSCLQACPAGSLPGDFKSGNLDVDPCVQRCFVASCPAASAKLIALDDCSRAMCATECASSGSSTCATCAQSKCLDQVNGCFTDACN